MDDHNLHLGHSQSTAFLCREKVLEKTPEYLSAHVLAVNGVDFLKESM